MKQQVLPPPRANQSPLHPELERRIWKPGVSGNPTGFSHKYGEMRRKLREFSYGEGTDFLISVVRDVNEDMRCRIVCMQEINMRGWGKPQDYNPQEDDRLAVGFDPSRLTPEELATLKAALQLMAKASVPTQDVVVEGSVVVTNDAQVIENE